MFGLVKQAIYDQLHRNYTKVNVECEALKVEIEQRDQSIREMADEIRDMDQLIYRMSQCTSWEAMRPIFNELQSKQEFRQREESDRIGAIMRKELIGVYAKPKQLPLASKGHPHPRTRDRSW